MFIDVKISNLFHLWEIELTGLLRFLKNGAEGDQLVWNPLLWPVKITKKYINRENACKKKENIWNQTEECKWMFCGGRLMNWQRFFLMNEWKKSSVFFCYYFLVCLLTPKMNMVPIKGRFSDKQCNKWTRCTLI